MNKINETTIQNWVVEENIFKQKIPDDDANFHYVIEYPQGNVMDIIQPKGKDDFLIFVCGTNVSPEHIELMRKASRSEREEFLYELKFHLNQLDPDFQLDVNDEFILSQFVLQDAIYEDGLTKNELMKTIKRLFKAKMACIWIMEKKFGLPTVAASSIRDNNSDDNVMFM